MTAATETIHYATISMVNTVSYNGASHSLSGSGEPMPFTATTYEDAEHFNWRKLPKNTPVLDLRREDFDTVWDTCIKPTYDTPRAKVDACRKAGICVVTAGGLDIIYRHHRSTPNLSAAEYERAIIAGLKNPFGRNQQRRAS